MSQATIDAALAYRHAGLQVVPSYEPAEQRSWKRPIGLWQQWTHDLVPDIVWETWLTGWQSRHNLGLITGSVSGGVFVIDLDTHSKPQAGGWWLGLIAVHNHGLELETPCQQTGGGGLQLLFRAPPGWRAPTRKTALGVDIRGEGGFAVLPPSHHSSGHDYAWLPGRAPDELDIATAPDWLCQAIDTLLQVQNSDLYSAAPVAEADSVDSSAGNSAGKENGASAMVDFTHSAGATPQTATPQTATPQTATVTPIGQFRLDGREDRMFRMVWAAVVGLKRRCIADRWPGGPLEVDRETVWQQYLGSVASRIDLHGQPDTPEIRAALLEKEGRGRTLFLEKWRYTCAKWDGAIAAAAARPDPNPDPQPGQPGQPGQSGWSSTGTSQEQAQDGFQVPPPVPLAFTPFTWLDQTKIPRREFLYGDHYIRKFVSAYIGTDGVGKSSLVIIDALAMASGKNIAGHAVKKRLKVVYWNGEDPQDELDRRIMAAALHHGLAAEDLEGWLFRDSGRLLPIVIAEENRGNFYLAQKTVDALVAAIQQNELDVLLIDPLIASHRVQENDNNAMERVVKTWAHVADITDCAINLLCHPRKTNGAEITAEDNRGASAAKAAYRSIKVINQMAEIEADKVGIKNPKSYFRVDNGKSSMLPPSQIADWYQIVSQELLNGPMGLPGDKVGVVRRWVVPTAFEGLTADDLHNVQNAIAAGKWRKDPQASAWVGKEIAKTLALPLPANNGKIKEMIKTWLESGALVSVDRKDETRRWRVFIEVGTWV